MSTVLSYVSGAWINARVNRTPAPRSLLLFDPCDTHEVGGLDLDARLELTDPEAVRGEELSYGIINTGTARLICGLGYTLEREADGTWTAGHIWQPGITPQMSRATTAGDPRSGYASNAGLRTAGCWST